MDLNFLKCGIAGGLAGLNVDILMYPIETIKTRIMGSSAKQNLSQSASKISKFKGFSVQLIISFPYSFTFFFVYQGIRDRLPNSHFTNFIAAVCGQTASNFLRNPLELIKQQMMVGRSDKAFSALKQVYSTLGLRGFYVGYSPALIRDIIFSAIQMPLYQHLKKPLSQLANKQQSSPFISGLSGSIAAIVAAVITCPLDVIKTRHMTMRMSEIKQNSSALNVAKIIFAQQGIKGFFRGVSYRAGMLTFGGSIYFYSLGYWKKALQVRDIQN